MSDSQSALSEVPALLEERRRYESWIAALDARRESTPKHVFERVQADYRARLLRVAEQLATHRQAIEEERGHLQSRLSILEAEEGLRRDERAELELRAHVGELAGDDAASAFGAVDHTIGLLVEERRGLEGRIAELTALLTDGDRTEPEPQSDAAQATAAAAEQSAAVEPEPEPALVSAVEQTAAAQPPSPPADVAVAVEQSVEPAPVVAAPASPPPPAKPEAPAAVPAPAPAAAGAAGSPAAAPADAPARSRGGRGSFDELAFLSSVVGKNDGGAHAAKKEATVAAPKHEGPLVERRSSEPLLKGAAGVVQEENGGESLLAGVENARLPTGEHPLAANVSANTPIVLRPATTLEQAKTLKCNECGGLNYPTEWYCERCGAELAAL